MTRQDLYDWCKTHDCDHEVVQTEGQAPLVYLINPINPDNLWAYINLPIDDKKVSYHMVNDVCKRLDIESPTMQSVKVKKSLWNKS